MSFTPYLNSQPLSTIENNINYRNSNRETLAGGSPVYYTPSTYPSGIGGGYGGPRYKEGYTYNNCPYPDNTYNGNCTWWCCGRAKDALGVNIPAGLGDADEWYDKYSGNKSTSVSNLKKGDIITFSGGAQGHVMFVEKIQNGIVTVSQSAYSQRSVWRDVACLVTSYPLNSLVVGMSVDMYKDLDTPHYYTVSGFIHIGNDDPDPPTPTNIVPLIVAMFMKSKNKKFNITRKNNKHIPI